MALFADLDEADFSLIHLPIEEVHYNADSVLYETGDEGSAVFTVRSGLIKLVQYLSDGTQRIVRLLRQGDTLGLEVLLDRNYEHAAVALRAAVCCRIPRNVVQRLSEETPRLHRQLMLRWHQSVARADEWITEMPTGPARARVARLLLRILHDEPGGDCDLFSREDVGAMLGVTTETASRVIAEFKRTQVILPADSHRVHCDETALRRIAKDA
ncbi:MAG: Crp/Fnr family transcriptional regulator [Rhodospirillaceae bacterium]|nr:MAG: Crp/Fnr family transcriptional regulator [Rhodospirillaceae bacterium]